MGVLIPGSDAGVDGKDDDTVFLRREGVEGSDKLILFIGSFEIIRAATLSVRLGVNGAMAGGSILEDLFGDKFLVALPCCLLLVVEELFLGLDADVPESPF